MGVLHLSRPYDSRVGCKNWGSGTKSTKEGGKNLGRFHLPEKTSYIQACLYLEADLPWSWDVFYRTDLETTKPSPKHLTHKP